MCRILLISIVLALLVPVTVVSAQESAEQVRPRQIKDNSNHLIRKHRKDLSFDASSTWSGWPASRAFDGDRETSWFSASKDAAALETDPWIEVTFPEDIAVRRVTVWGNREPRWLTGYSVTVARIEFRDGDGKILCNQRARGSGESFDYDFDLGGTLENVRRIRLVSLSDQGDENPDSDIAIGEFEIE